MLVCNKCNATQEGASQTKRTRVGGGESWWSQVGSMSVPVIILSVTIAIRGASFGGLLLPKVLAPALETFGAQHAGTTLFLLSTAIGQLCMLLTSALPFASSGAALELLPLFAGLCASVLAHPSMAADASEEAQISTSLAAIGVCTIVVSLSFAISVSLGLGSVFRRCPACVLKGSLAGIGSFLLQSALRYDKYTMYKYTHVYYQYQKRVCKVLKSTLTHLSHLQHGG